MLGLPFGHANHPCARCRANLAVITPYVGGQSVFELVARLALQGELEVVDGGNTFNAYHVVRTLRRQTTAYAQAMARIRLSRVFTCYQMATLLAELEGQPRGGTPLLALDFLSTFADENVAVAERRRLLKTCLGHLRRMTSGGPVGVWVRARTCGARGNGGVYRPGLARCRARLAAGSSAAGRPAAIGVVSDKNKGGSAWGERLPSITQVFLQEEDGLRRFRRALRRADQLALDELLDAAQQHLAAAAYAGSALPFEIFLLAMLLEEHKEVTRLREMMEGSDPPAARAEEAGGK